MRIAVFLPNWIGDVVMATPAIDALWQGMAHGSLVAVGRPYVQGVVEGSPWFDHFISADPKKFWTTAKQLRPLDCDLAVLFPNSLRSAVTAWLANIPRRLGYDRDCRKPMLTESLQPLRDAGGKIAVAPVLDAYNRLVATLGASATRRMRLFTTPRDEAAAETVWQQFVLARYPEVIALNPGAAFGAAKHWPAKYFAELADRLVAERNAGVVVLCGPGERDLARQIVEMSQHRDVYSLADVKLSLGLTKAMVRRCDLLVTTDSGPRHFAAAFGRPVVTLFGPTHINWTETYHPGAIHLQRPVDCGPCQKRVCPLDHRCMTELTPDLVFPAAAKLLAGHREAARAG